MPKLNMFFRLTKVDEAQRLVYGIATAEVADKSGEVCDYEGTVPYYKAWSDEIHKASGGKSLGNVREMHDNKAVGKLTSINFNDDAKQIEICAKIVEDSTWVKVVEGVLTGFSQGGDYAKRWKDPADATLTRYIAVPSEVSVVDNPCLGVATFEYIKADGSTEMRKLNSIVDPKEVGKVLKQVWSATDGKTFDSKRDAIKYQADLDATAAISPIEKQALDAANAINDLLAKKEFSDEKRKEMAASGEAMADGSFPIESAKDVENAVHDWGRTGSKPDVKAHIMRRAKAIGAEGSLPDDWRGKKEEKAKAIDDLKKYCEEVFDACAAMEALKQLIFVLMGEEHEVDRADSEEKAQVTMLEDAIDKIKEFIISELGEEEDDEDDEEMISVMAAAAGVDASLLKTNKPLMTALAKRGRHSKADAAKIAEMNDHVDDMGGHVEKLGKMHKAMNETHEEMGDTTHAEGHAEMGSHLKKLGKHIEKMDKCYKGMEMCMKGLGVGAEGAGGQDGSPKEPDEGKNEKMVKLEADNQALVKANETIIGALETLKKRLETLEQEPKQSGNRPALFSLEKGNEVRAIESGDASVDAHSPNVFGSGLAPSEARRR